MKLCHVKILAINHNYQTTTTTTTIIFTTTLILINSVTTTTITIYQSINSSINMYPYLNLNITHTATTTITTTSTSTMTTLKLSFRPSLHTNHIPTWLLELLTTLQLSDFFVSDEICYFGLVVRMEKCHFPET